MKTHRCKGSLKAEVSIRYDYKYTNLRLKDDYKHWRLFKSTLDNEWNKYLLHVAEIEYCPFCGKKLEEED